MYRIEITNNGMTEVLHDVNTNSYRRAASGTFTRDLYAVHSATITVYPQNPCFEHLHELTTLVKIINTKTGRVMFDGHILQIPDNSMTDGGKFEKKLLCESELGYLCDSTQLLHNYGEVDNTSFLVGCLDYHNEQMAQSPERQILLGAVSQHGMHQKVTSYRSTMEEIKQNLISVNGGILDLQRNTNQKLVLNYWQDSDYGNVCNTKIELAHNLKSLTLGTDMTGVITRLFPLGAVVNSETGERLTVSSVNNNCPYIDDLEAIGKWGIKTGTVTFDDVTDPSILLSRGREYILTVNQAKRTFQANVLDLSTIGADADEFDIGNQYLFDVNRMGLHEYLRVTQMTVDIYKPYQPQITIGDKLERITDITTQARNYIAFEAPKQYSSILQQAKTNASALIAAATTGYVVLYPNDCPREILIMDTDDIHTAKSVWRMNRNGIGYSHSDVAGEAYDGEYGIAMTIDGAIVADFITAGHLFADRIRGGTLTVGGSEAGGNGVISVLDDAGNEICRLDKYGASIFGEVYTKNKDGYWLRLANGSLTGGESGVTTATIDTSAVVVDGDHGISYHGLQFSSDVVYFDCDFFAINGATGTTGYLNYVGDVSFSTTQIEVVTDVSIDGNGALQLTKATIEYVSGWSWYKTGVYFQNGIMCTQLEEWATGGADEHTSGVSTETGGTGGSHVYPPIRPTGDYTNLEYIQTTNRQFFNTGYIPNANTKIECEYLLLGNYDEYNQALFGSPSVNVNYNSKGNHKIELTNGGQSVDSSKSFPWNQKIKVVLDNSQLSWYDGNALLDSIAMSAGSSFGNYPLWVGCINDSGTVLNFGEFRIYSFKIYANNNLVMDFVPVKRNSDGVCGMLNTLTNVFYPDANGVGFLSSDFEDNYQAVNAVQTSGNLYVDTNFIHTANTRFVIDFIPSLSGVSSFVQLWGAEANVGGNWTANDWWSYIENGALYVQRGRTESQPVSADLTQRMQITAEGLTAQFAFADGTTQTVQISGASVLSGLLTIWLFKVHYDGNPQAGISQRFYSCQIYENNTLVRDFIPVKRLSDNALMLYDRVSGEEYHPIGGTFTEVS